MAISTVVSKFGVWFLLGALTFVCVQNVGCSGSFTSCNQTRTCPLAAEDAGAGGETGNGNGDAGTGDSSSGSGSSDGGSSSGHGGRPSTGGAGSASAGTAGDSDAAGAGDQPADGGGGGAERAGAGGDGSTLGECRAVAAPTGPKVTLVKLNESTSQTVLTNGQIRPGHYHLTRLSYYEPATDLTDDSPKAIVVEVSGDTASISFDRETLLIRMGVPSSTAPQSIVISCSVSQPELALTMLELKALVSYQADATTLQLITPRFPGSGWEYSEYLIDR